jgi:hypothetical protein
LDYSERAIIWRWSLGEDVFAFTSTWSKPPDVILPTDTVKIEIAVKLIENRGNAYSANGSLAIWFDSPNVDPGFVQNPIGFTNDKNENGSIAVTHRLDAAPLPPPRTVWVKGSALPNGRIGSQIALLVCAYNGRNAGTKYIYEWKKLP